MSAIWTWLTSHQAILGGMVVGILDFVFAISPNLESNGILHWIYSFFKPAPKA